MKKENPNFKNEISQIILKLLREKIFSIKNTSDKKHKVITFLGWKIKYKRRKNNGPNYTRILRNQRRSIYQLPLRQHYLRFNQR